MEWQETNVAPIIRQLDKEALNLYTTFELSLNERTELDRPRSNGLSRSTELNGWRTGSHEQDYRN